MSVKRDAELHKLCEELRKVKSFIGSIAEVWEGTSYMRNDQVIRELKRQADNLRAIKKFMSSSADKCGDLTKNEKKILMILEAHGYTEEKV